MAAIRFYSVTQEQYDRLKGQSGGLNSDYIYFVHDTGRICKGDKDCSTDVTFSTTVPTTLAKGKVQVVEVTVGSDKFYNVYVGNASGAAVKAVPGTAASKNAFSNVSTYGAYVPTVNAVKGYVDDQISSVNNELDEAYVGVDWNGTNGTLSFSKSDSAEPADVETLTGVAHDVEWDESTLTLTISQYGSDDIEVNIPKDMFLQKGEYKESYTFNSGQADQYTAPAIVLTVNVKNGQTASQQVIAIPVGSLVDTYTVGSTDTVTLNIDKNNSNKITAAIKFDNTTLAGSEKILVKTTKGLQASGKSLSDISKEIDDDVKAAKDAIEAQLVGAGTANKVVVSTATGITRSSASLGGATFAATTTATTLATEKGVESAIDSALTWKTVSA